MYIRTWQFMTEYAESFWKAKDYAFEVFSVIMAWAITIGAAWFVYAIIRAIGEMIADDIRERIMLRNINSKEESVDGEE